MRVFIVGKRIVIRLLIVTIIVGSSIIWTKFVPNNVINVFLEKRDVPIYYVDTDEKKVAISFDAAWGCKYTKGILDILDEYNANATFFLVGFWVDKYPDMVKEIYDRGHEIGNHSSNHPYMSKLSKSQIVEELKKTEQKIKEITNERPVLFRPPFGDYNNRLLQTCKEQGYYVIQWDVDSLDWKELGVQPVVDRITRNIQNGSIILCHNNAKYVTQYLPIVLQKLKDQGYKVVSISELIYKDNYYIDNTGKQIKKAN